MMVCWVLVVKKETFGSLFLWVDENSLFRLPFGFMFAF